MNQPMSRRPRTNTALLPTRSFAGPALIGVTMVMTFLACLALGSSLLADRAASQWLARATSAISVQIVETTRFTVEEQLPAVRRQLGQTPGIESFRELSRSDLVSLLEPWLGAGNITDDLPLPLLIEVQSAKKTALNTRALAAELTTVAPGAHLDTHGRWRQTLENTARALRLFAGLVLAMVAIATATVILFATRAGLLANEEILDILHQTGAFDGFISLRFEAHFVRAALLASLSGLVAAWSFFYALGGLVAEAREIDFLLNLTIIPFGTVLLSWLVTRISVRQRLKIRI